MYQNLNEINETPQQKNKIYWLGFLLVVIIGAGALGFYQLIQAKEEEPTPLELEGEERISGEVGFNCRYGVTPLQSNQFEWINTIGAGWHLDFRAEPLGTASSQSEYVHIIRINQNMSGSTYLDSYTVSPALNNSGLGNIIDNNPGKLWLVGNEPDVSIVQDNTYPEVYARAYHQVYNYIKNRDPSAQVAIGGLSMMTPGRLQYLDIVWDTYLELYGKPMEVDVWNFHLYILSEYREAAMLDADGRVALGTDPAIAKLSSEGNAALCSQSKVYCRSEHDSLAIFAEQIVGLRTWMKEHGQQNKPLILSEYSLLYPFVDYDNATNPTSCFLMDESGGCFTEARVNSFMNATFDYLETAANADIGYPYDGNHLVQQWMWFSLHTDPEASGGSSRLLKDNYASFPSGGTSAFNGVGTNLYNYVQNRPTAVNFYAAEAVGSTGVSVGNGGDGKAELTVKFYNNGNTGASGPIQVSFYSNAAMTDLIGTTSVSNSPHFYGCGRHEYSATVEWSGLGSGLHKYWVKVNSNTAVSESNNSDNTAQGFVIIDGQNMLLPVVKK